MVFQRINAFFRGFSQKREMAQVYQEPEVIKIFFNIFCISISNRCRAYQAHFIYIVVKNFMYNFYISFAFRIRAQFPCGFYQ